MADRLRHGRGIADLIEPHVALFNAFAATVQVLIGLGLLCRRTVRPALLASFAWAIGIWFSGEGLGMIFAGTASPLTGAPGAALLHILAGLMCWPRAATPRSPTCSSVARCGLIGARGARLAWAVLWLGSAALWLLPVNDGANAVHDAISAAPSGAGWLSSVLSFAANMTAGDGTVIALAMAILSAIVGIAVLRDWHARAFLATGRGAHVEQARARDNNSSRSRSFAQRSAARRNSPRASVSRPRRTRRSPRTLGNRW